MNDTDRALEKALEELNGLQRRSAAIYGAVTELGAKISDALGKAGNALAVAGALGEWASGGDCPAKADAGEPALF